MTYINNNGDKVTLLENTATNKYGNKLLWVKCENGAIVSIWETEFKNNFTAIEG